MIFSQAKEVAEQYERGSIPDPDELSGEYSVVVPWFPWVSLEPFKHRKSFETGGQGSNVVLNGFRFAPFKLMKESDSLLIDYDSPGNPSILRGLLDRLRRLPDGRLIGRTTYRILGREVFLLYFELRPE